MFILLNNNKKPLEDTKIILLLYLRYILFKMQYIIFFTLTRQFSSCISEEKHKQSRYFMGILFINTTM